MLWIGPEQKRAEHRFRNAPQFAIDGHVRGKGLRAGARGVKCVPTRRRQDHGAAAIDQGMANRDGAAVDPTKGAQGGMDDDGRGRIQTKCLQLAADHRIGDDTAGLGRGAGHAAFRDQAPPMDCLTLTIQGATRLSYKTESQH